MFGQNQMQFFALIKDKFIIRFVLRLLILHSFSIRGEHTNRVSCDMIENSGSLSLTLSENRSKKTLNMCDNIYIKIKILCPIVIKSSLLTNKISPNLL